MCGQTVETVGHWVGMGVPHWVTVPGWRVGPQVVFVGQIVVRTGQIVSAIGQWVCWVGQDVGAIGQTVVSAAPLGHCVGLAASGHWVGWALHSVTVPGVIVGVHPGWFAGQRVVSCGQTVCWDGHWVGTSAGQEVAICGQVVWTTGHFV
jgi:hypothetical protein